MWKHGQISKQFLSSNLEGFLLFVLLGGGLDQIPTSIHGKANV